MARSGYRAWEYVIRVQLGLTISKRYLIWEEAEIWKEHCVKISFVKSIVLTLGHRQGTDPGTISRNVYTTSR